MMASTIAVIVSLESGALSVVLQTLLSGRSDLPFGIFTAIMMSIHLPIAVVEGILTALVVHRVKESIIEKGIIAEESAGGSTLKTRGLIALGGMAILLGMVVAWFASPFPDGLEWTIQKITGSAELHDKGSGISALFARIQKKVAFLPDYNFAEKTEPANLPNSEDANAASIKSDSHAEEAKWPAIEPGTSLSGMIGSLITAVIAILLGLILQKAGRANQQNTAQQSTISE
jgi:cobalt/nickel transport system permease protein